MTAMISCACLMNFNWIGISCTLLLTLHGNSKEKLLLFPFDRFWKVRLVELMDLNPGWQFVAVTGQS